ncbi:MAG TPA: hypothetical protein VMY18_13210 [Acidobacteriota bacterium]|nr:hypothetical protein [Acidobacteriota bacterium]
MIELTQNGLTFSFPEVHPEAKLVVEFQRTFRIPDDDKSYPLPPGFGRFPLRHVDDFAGNVPSEWLRRAGVMLPMYQSEALWINFHGRYPFAVKVAAGKINAVTGEAWDDDITRRPQDYLVTPDQPWLDGYCVEKGSIRQFVAMPLGSGYSAEEQITGKAEHGGLQILAYPMKAEAYDRGRGLAFEESGSSPKATMSFLCSIPDMALAPGGKMRQEIYDDPNDFADWDQAHRSRCFVHIANSLIWQSITGEQPPTVPPTAKMYNNAGLPWFEYYAEGKKAVGGGAWLQIIKSVASLGKEKGEVPLPENASVAPDKIIQLRSKLKKNQVREGTF